jgi:hypothetical protein
MNHVSLSGLGKCTQRLKVDPKSRRGRRRPGAERRGLEQGRSAAWGVVRWWRARLLSRTTRTAVLAAGRHGIGWTESAAARSTPALKMTTVAGATVG